MDRKYIAVGGEAVRQPGSYAGLTLNFIFFSPVYSPPRARALRDFIVALFVSLYTINLMAAAAR